VSPGRTARWIAVAAVACGCGAKPHILAPGQVGVGRITVNGVDRADVDDLVGGLGLTRARELAQPYARYLVALDRRRIEGYYLRHGFLSATVDSATRRRGGVVDVVFQVTEGKRATLTGVEISGLPADVSAAELRDTIPIEDGAPFNYATYDLARPALTTVLESHGYARARVDATVVADRAASTTAIRVAVDPGPKAVFGPVTVLGVEGRMATAVRHRLHVIEGDPYSPRAIADSRVDVSDLGRFSLVRIEPDKTGTGPIVPIAVQLGARAAHELRMGGGFGYNPVSYEARARASYGVDGWPTTMTNTKAEFRPAVVRLLSESTFQPRIEAVGSIERLDLFRPRITGSIEASFAYLALEAYTSYGPRVHVAARSPLYRRIVSASVGWQLQELAFRDLDAALSDAKIMELGLDHLERLGAFDQALIVDLRDDPLTTTRGVYGEIRVAEGTRAAGGAFTYARIVPDVRGFVTALGTTLAARVSFGLISGDVPVTERFFAGGAANQRGFGERRLSPTAVAVVDGKERRVPYGGAAMVATSFELRRQLAKLSTDVTLGGVVFLDGADVTERPGDLDLGHLHWALGAGFRIKYVVPFRLDVGYRLNRTGPTDPDPATTTLGRMALQLSVGEAF